MIRILYFETTAFLPSSAHFLETLQERAARRQCEFRFVDEAQFAPSRTGLADRATRKLLGRPLFGYRALNQALVIAARELRPNIAIIAKGAYIAPATLLSIKRETGATLINWAADDPFNSANATRDLLRSIPIYDLYVCTKKAVIRDVRSAGSPRTAYLRFGYKPGAFFPEQAANEVERERFRSDVVFIGGCDSDRAPFFERLLERIPGVRLHLYGAHWDGYPAFRPHWRGQALGRDYRLAMSGAKIAVNLVRRANRDDHVMRTFEIPACGAFMLAERTDTHQELFVEDREAVFFGSPEEMAGKIGEFLPRDDARAAIAAAGHRKIISGRHTYADRLDEIVGLVTGETRNDADTGALHRAVVAGG